MPKDSKGNYHPNIQRAHAADRMSAPAKPKEAPPVAGNTGDGAMSTTLNDHGDGTYHTEGSDGAREEHPSIGHALMHMAAKHSEGSHMHMHEDGAGEMTSHHVSDGGKVEGPHQHDGAEAAAEHMKSVMGGGTHDPGMKQGPDWPSAPASASLHGM